MYVLLSTRKVPENAHITKTTVSATANGTAAVGTDYTSSTVGTGARKRQHNRQHDGQHNRQHDGQHNRQHDGRSKLSSQMPNETDMKTTTTTTILTKEEVRRSISIPPSFSLFLLLSFSLSLSIHY